MSSASLKIGLSACFFHADPMRPIFKGKTLQYMEQSMGNWVMGQGALPWVLPRPDGSVTAADLIQEVDGLLLQGGSDLAPESYGETPLQPQWQGDRERDLYEIELLNECRRVGKPVLGICRGLQLINVALGGTLYQDLATQRPLDQLHRDWDLYEDLHHGVRFEPGSLLQELYPDCESGMVNSVHHQGIKELAQGLVIEASSTEDGVIEAVRGSGDEYLFAVQWHPEFTCPSSPELESEAAPGALLPREPIMHSFLGAALKARCQ